MCVSDAPPTASLSHFLPHVGLCFKLPLCSSCSMCWDISHQGPKAPLAGWLVTGNRMACSILGCPHKHPAGVIAHCQSWRLLPRLKHGHVEPINQPAWYHAQLNTPVRPESIDMWFILSGSPSGSASHKSSCTWWGTCLFLFTSSQPHTPVFHPPRV